MCEAQALAAMTERITTIVLSAPKRSDRATFRPLFCGPFYAREVKYPFLACGICVNYILLFEGTNEGERIGLHRVVWDKTVRRSPIRGCNHANARCADTTRENRPIFVNLTHLGYGLAVYRPGGGNLERRDVPRGMALKHRDERCQ